MDNAKRKKLIDELGVELGEKTFEGKENKSVTLLNNISEKIENSNGINNNNVKILIDIFNSLRTSEEKLLLSDDKLKKGLSNIKLLLREDLEIKNKEQVIVKELGEIIKHLITKKFTEVEVKNPVKDITVNNFPKEFDIKNINDLEKLFKKYQLKEISVNNFPDKTQDVKVINQKEFPKEIKIKNPVTEIKVKKPVWYKEINLDNFLNKLKNFFTDLTSVFSKDLDSKIFTANIDKYKKLNEALAVKLVDDKGNQIIDFKPFVNVNPAGSGGSVGTLAKLEEVLTELKTMNSLIPSKYDYVKVSYPDTLTETYTYKLGGATGSTVSTVTTVYTNSNKEFIDTITKT